MFEDARKLWWREADTLLWWGIVVLEYCMPETLSLTMLYNCKSLNISNVFGKIKNIKQIFFWGKILMMTSGGAGWAESRVHS